MEGADHLRNTELCVYFVKLELQLEEWASVTFDFKQKTEGNKAAQELMLR